MASPPSSNFPLSCPPEEGRRRRRAGPLKHKASRSRPTTAGSSSDEPTSDPRQPKSRRKGRRGKGPAGGPSGDPPSYHLQWEEHLATTLAGISTLLASQTFVDVTLVCEEDPGPDGTSRHHSVRAHKVILSHFSSYFRAMFWDSPCKHPVIVLKDFSRWEVEALLDFMYRGLLVVRPDRLETLIKAADALQIRGLRECIEDSAEWKVLGRSSSSHSEFDGVREPASFHHKHSSSPNNNNNNMGPLSPKLLNLSMSGPGCGYGEEEEEDGDPAPRSRRQQNSMRNGPQTAPRTSRPQTPTNSGRTAQNLQYVPPDASPPFPRRKQARPRRRSGDFVAQDLRITVTPPPGPASLQLNLKKENLEKEHENNNEVLDFTMNHGAEKGPFDGVPYLMKGWDLRGLDSPIPLQRSSPLKAELDSDDGVRSPIDPYRSPPVTPDSPTLLRPPKQFRGRNGPEGYPFFGDGLLFKTSPPSPSFFMSLNNGHPLLPGHHSDSESNNPETSSTPPTVFSPAGFPQGPAGNSAQGQANNNQSPGPGAPWPGLPLGPAPIFGRHRAQHSAPRGGPPRAWSNADLTEALHNVWNKKMTTSQASRIFGIPYNSLLMYVRGKYGKSLKLDLLKKGLDLAMENSDKAAAAAAAKAKGPSPSNAVSSPSPNHTGGHPAPPHNNNNNNSVKSGKSSKCGSPPAGPGSLLLESLHQGPGSRRDPEQLLPPGFHPFPSVGSIFRDYSPPFPFPSAAAAAALSHILPQHHHHHHHPLPLGGRRHDVEK